MRDITVEVRDVTLERVGQITREFLNLEAVSRFCNVGDWKLELPVGHPLVEVLMAPGSGIVISDSAGREIFSGPTVPIERSAKVSTPGGTIVFSGVSDDVLLADALAYPQPSNPDPATQLVDRDERTGPVESVMHAYVNANIGPGAPSARRAAFTEKLVMGVDLGRGPKVTKTARFKKLGVLLSELAPLADLGFRVIQRGDVLVFETYQVTDRTRDVRLDIRNNTLSGHRTIISPPAVTDVIVAGKGEGTDRAIIHLSTEETDAARAAWGRRIEHFLDQRSVDDEEDLVQAGMEYLADEGVFTVSVQAVPMEDSFWEFGRDWEIGDRVTVVVDDQELSSTVTGWVFKVDKNGVRVGATIGDPEGFDVAAALAKRVSRTEDRVSQLEREAETARPVPHDGPVSYLPADSFADSDPPEDYPEGFSVFIATDGWGATGDVQVITARAGGRVTQQKFELDTGRLSVRQHTGSGWGAWIEIVHTGLENVTLGAVTAPTLRLTSIGDAGPDTSTHAIQIGPGNGQNLRLDSDEVLSADNGTAGTLHLQADGGRVVIHDNSPGDGLLVRGQIVAEHPSARNHLALRRSGFDEIALYPSTTNTSAIADATALRIYVGGSHSVSISPSGVYVAGSQVHFNTSNSPAITFGDTRQLRFQNVDGTKLPLDIRNNIGDNNDPGLRSFATYERTTTASANVHITDSANFSRSTSSILFKRDVEEIEPEYYNRVLELRPVWYRSEADLDPPNWSFYGLIAEEVAEIDPRLVHWGHPDGPQAMEPYEGKEPPPGLIPESVQYDRIGVLLISVVRDQQSKIEDLEQRVAALEAALEGTAGEEKS